jgi:hypothetical protein
VGGCLFRIASLLFLYRPAHFCSTQHGTRRLDCIGPAFKFRRIFFNFSAFPATRFYLYYPYFVLLSIHLIWGDLEFNSFIPLFLSLPEREC